MRKADTDILIALAVLLRESRKDRLTKTGYRRVNRALVALGFSGHELTEALLLLEYRATRWEEVSE